MPPGSVVIRNASTPLGPPSTPMTKRSYEAHAGRVSKRRRSGAHQRHTRKLAQVLDMPQCSGVFMSCARGKERKAATELVELMEEHAQRMYADYAPQEASCTDIESQIEKELADMRRPAEPSRISSLDTDTECLCFIQCLPPVDSFSLLKDVLRTMEATGASRSRYVQRLVPVRVLCRADTDSIRTAATAALAPAFADQPRTYRVEPRIRSHTSLSRDVLIPLVASCVPTNAAHRVDLAHPDVIIVVEVLRNVCGIGTVDEYERFGKWNVQTLVERHNSDNVRST